jgi:hypothetical protein
MLTPDIDARNNKCVQNFRAWKFFVQFGKQNIDPKGFLKLKRPQGDRFKKSYRQYKLAGREVQCSETKGTVRVHSYREEHNACDLVHDQHANHRRSKPGPYDTQLSRMFVVTIVPCKIDMKAVPLEDAFFLNTTCNAKTTIKQEVLEEPATYTFLSMFSTS